MADPKELIDALEQNQTIPPGREERFCGYGVMGVPFSSGDVLALRRWPGSSLGCPYTSIWHRNPEGEWTFIQDADSDQACTRYFSSVVTQTLQCSITIRWTSSYDFTVTVEGEFNLDWQVSLSRSMGTRFMNLTAGIIPSFLWRRKSMLTFMGHIASRLGAGRINLTGLVPNGQWFISNPRYVWTVSSSAASVSGRDLGTPCPLPEQVHLGDIWLPQEGRFFVGRAFLETFDPSRHLSAPIQKH